VLDGVDHDHRAAGTVDRAQPRELLPVRGRIGEQEVLEAHLPEPERLGEAERHQPAEARIVLERRRNQRPAAERLRGHADRLAAGAPLHVQRVRPHGVEIDEGKGGVDRREDRLVPLVGPGGRRAFSGCHRAD
jgi:hypothetical protein